MRWPSKSTVPAGRRGVRVVPRLPTREVRWGAFFGEGLFDVGGRGFEEDTAADGGVGVEADGEVEEKGERRRMAMPKRRARVGLVRAARMMLMRAMRAAQMARMPWVGTKSSAQTQARAAARRRRAAGSIWASKLEVGSWK